MVVLGKNFLRGEAGEMDHAPEAIASCGEMMPCEGRGHSRIYSAKDHRKLSGDDIWERIGHGVPHKFSKYRGRSAGACLAHPRIDRVTPDDLDKAQPHPQVRQPRRQGWLVCALKDLFSSIVHVLTTKGHFLGKELFNERNFLLSTIMTP